MKEIGQRLRDEREAKGISLRAVEEETKIRRRYLEALEEGREADLPGEVYLKGFLRTYGNFLGMDGAALVEEYKERKLERQAAAEEGQDGSAPAHNGAVQRAAPTVRPEPVVTASRPIIARPQEGPAASIRTLIVALLVAGLLGAIGYLGWQVVQQLNSRPEPVEPPPDPPPAAVENPPPQQEDPPPPKLPDPPKVTMARGTGEDVIFTVPAPDVTVRLEPGPDRVWMQATVNGEVVYEGVPAEPQEFAGREISIRVGHMNGVSLVVNGQRFEQPLENGPYTLIFKGE